MSVTQDEILQHRKNGSWKTLEAKARAIVASAQIAAGSSMNPVLGGGTRLMLSLTHRISDDIDLFITNPAWIGYISPRLNDEVDAITLGYEESATSLKLKFKEGELDLIVAASLLDMGRERSDLCAFDLDTVSEVIAKKLFFRGWAMTARDLYDWWFISTHHPGHLCTEQLAKLTQSRHDAIEQALGLIGTSGSVSQSWENIRASVKPEMIEATTWATAEISRWRETAQRVSFRHRPPIG